MVFARVFVATRIWYEPMKQSLFLIQNERFKIKNVLLGSCLEYLFAWTKVIFVLELSNIYSDDELKVEYWVEAKRYFISIFNNQQGIISVQLLSHL